MKRKRVSRTKKYPHVVRLPKGFTRDKIHLGIVSQAAVLNTAPHVIRSAGPFVIRVALEGNFSELREFVSTLETK